MFEKAIEYAGQLLDSLNASFRLTHQTCPFRISMASYPSRWGSLLGVLGTPAVGKPALQKRRSASLTVALSVIIGTSRVEERDVRRDNAYPHESPSRGQLKRESQIFNTGQI